MSRSRIQRLFFVPVLMALLACSSGDGAGGDGGRDARAANDDPATDARAGDVSAGDAADAGAPATPCDELPGGAPPLEVYRLEDPDSSLRVILAREAVDQGVGHSTIFALRRLAVRREGACVLIDLATLMDYENSHHNWRDKAWGETGSVHYEVAIDYVLQDLSSFWRLTLTATEIGTGQVVLEPVELTPTGGPLACWSCWSHLPVWINEIMANNQTGWQDEQGEAARWIELWNPSASDVDLTGYALSDDPADPDKWPLPAGTILARHAYLMIAADGQTDQGPLHTNFALSPAGGQLLLSGPDGRSSGERPFGPQSPDVSLIVDFTTRAYVPAATPTPGADNPNLP